MGVQTCLFGDCYLYQRKLWGQSDKFLLHGCDRRRSTVDYSNVLFSTFVPRDKGPTDTQTKKKKKMRIEGTVNI